MRSKYTYHKFPKLALLIVMSALLFTCRPPIPELDHSPYRYELRSEWPEIIVPANNPTTQASVALGKQLFFDKRLSIDQSVSCASCHKPEHGFADGVSKSIGVNDAKGFRNSGALTNVAYLPYFNRDGGVKSLDVFSAVPIEDHAEMNFNLVLLKERFQNDKPYTDQAQEIYGKPMDGFVATRALASYLRTFISDQSPYDAFLYDHDSTALTDQQKRGLTLFNGKGQCATCHNGINLTNYAFENNGLYPTYKNIDRGRQRITSDPRDEGKFRVASLRNIAKTAPYMHDGSVDNLASVLHHYANHGASHPTKNPIIDQINLTKTEQEDIISFLHSLTDESFLNNPQFKRRG